MANKLTLDRIFQIIDNHLESDTEFLFVTDKYLAEIICEYVYDNYGLLDENIIIDDKYKDYYVSVYNIKNELNFCCESAKNKDGTYKYSDAIHDYVDYFICNDMTENEADEYLLGDNCTWSWIDIVLEDEDDCEEENLNEGNQCDCPICQAEREVLELDCYCNECQNDFMKDAIEECLEKVFNGCPDCAVKSIINLAFKCLEFGKQNVKQEMYEFLDE